MSFKKDCKQTIQHHSQKCYIHNYKKSCFKKSKKKCLKKTYGHRCWNSIIRKCIYAIDVPFLNFFLKINWDIKITSAGTINNKLKLTDCSSGHPDRPRRGRRCHWTCPSPASRCYWHWCHRWWGTLRRSCSCSGSPSCPTSRPRGSLATVFPDRPPILCQFFWVTDHTLARLAGWPASWWCFLSSPWWPFHSAAIPGCWGSNPGAGPAWRSPRWQISGKGRNTGRSTISWSQKASGKAVTTMEACSWRPRPWGWRLLRLWRLPLDEHSWRYGLNFMAIFVFATPASTPRFVISTGVLYLKVSYFQITRRFLHELRLVVTWVYFKNIPERREGPNSKCICLI